MQAEWHRRASACVPATFGQSLEPPAGVRTGVAAAAPLQHNPNASALRSEDRR